MHKFEHKQKIKNVVTCENWAFLALKLIGNCLQRSFEELQHFLLPGLCQIWEQEHSKLKPWLLFSFLFCFYLKPIPQIHNSCFLTHWQESRRSKFTDHSCNPEPLWFSLVRSELPAAHLRASTCQLRSNCGPHPTHPLHTFNTHRASHRATSWDTEDLTLLWPSWKPSSEIRHLSVTAWRPPLWCHQHIFDYTRELWALKETQKPIFDWIKRRDVWLISVNVKTSVSAAALHLSPVIKGAVMLNDTVVLVCKWEPTAIKLHPIAERTMKILRNDMTITTAFLQQA